MSDALLELEALREATRVRLSPSAVRELRFLARSYGAVGERSDKLISNGLAVLLDMHDKLEAIRNG